MALASRSGARALPAASDLASAADALQPHEADQRLRVRVRLDERVELVEGPGLDLDALLALGVGLPHALQAGGEEDVGALVGEPAARVEARDEVPGAGA